MEDIDIALTKDLERAIKEIYKTKYSKLNIIVEPSRNSSFGDYSSSIALSISKIEKKDPMEIAEKIVKILPSSDYKANITKPGFINFTLENEYLLRQLNKLLKNPRKITPQIDKKQKINIEYISANPTGPIHLANARGGISGDVLSNILEEAGFQVEREYYINDVGKQVKTLGLSVALRYKELLGEKIEFPEDGYQGEYIIDLAKEILEENGDQFKNLDFGILTEKMREIAYPRMLEKIKQSVKALNIKYDNWFSERDLYESGQVDEVLAELNKKGLLYEAEGATWFKSSKFGDDKDRVVKREDGSETYFASDIAYLKNKLEKRGFNQAVIFVGADHAGWVPRIKAVQEAIEIKNTFMPIVFQWVKLLKDGKEVSLSKRKGNIVTIEELLGLVSLDVARYFFLTRSYDTHLLLNLNEMQEESQKNPVYYIQYAYARISSLEKESKGKIEETLDISNLEDEAELLLAKEIIKYPNIIRKITQNLQVHSITSYLYDLASAFHHFYDTCRILSEKDEVKTSRFALALAAKIIIKKCLDLMGIGAPQKM